MNPDQNLQSLAFFRMEYPIDQVVSWLDQGIDCFSFDSYFPATPDPSRPIYLCCFTLKGGAYVNPFYPDLLAPYAGGVLVQTGPLKLTANLISGKAMKDFIDGHPDDDFLLFTPAVDANNQVYYKIVAFDRSDTGDVIDDGELNSNPSPPATAMVVTEVY